MNQHSDESLAAADSTADVEVAAEADAEVAAGMAAEVMAGMEERLDDAVEKIDSVTEGAYRSELTSPSAGIVPLMERLLRSASRREAIVELVHFLESCFDDSTVRCGYGKAKLIHLYDRRFGWLGPESSLYEEWSKQWETPQRRASDSADEEIAFVGRQGDLRCWFPNEDGSTRYEIWIQGESIGPESLAWFTPAISVVTLAIWSRPVRSLPKSAKRIARRRKTSLAIGGLALCMLAAWPVHYRVRSTARIETIHQRIVSAPFDATLLTSKVRPGDTVRQGDVLLVLDGRPLRLECESIEAEIQQAAKEHDVALVTGRVAEAQQAALKEQQLNRHYDLLSDRLKRLDVLSPIDGVVVIGDLQRYEGTSLERGQTLIEVAPMDKMVLEVEIPEYEIGYVGIHAKTRVKIDAIGGPSITLPLQDVFPRSELRDDRNVFIGRIELDNQDGRLRPGMLGEATTYGPMRPWVWSWIRGSVERVLWWIGY